MKSRTLAGGIAAVLCGVLITSLALRRRNSLQGKVAIVTGGGRGLGLAISRALAKEGCRLALCSRDQATIDQAVVSLGGYDDVWGMACDVSQPEEVNRFVEKVLARYGRIDILVNNAGQCYVGPATELTEEDILQALRNTFWSQYHPTKSVLPHMRLRKSGHILNITSLGGKLPIPHQGAYVVGKYAATGWSQTLAIELRREGIAVSTVTPPPIRNGAPLHTHFKGDYEGEFEWFAQTLNDPWMATSAEKVAGVVVGLLQSGGGEHSISAGAAVFARLYAAFPNLTSKVLTLFERRMPPAPTTQLEGPSPMKLGAQIAYQTTSENIRNLAAESRDNELRYYPHSALLSTQPLQK